MVWYVYYLQPFLPDPFSLFKRLISQAARQIRPTSPPMHKRAITSQAPSHSLPKYQSAIPLPTISDSRAQTLLGQKQAVSLLERDAMPVVHKIRQKVSARSNLKICSLNLDSERPLGEGWRCSRGQVTSNIYHRARTAPDAPIL